MLVLHVVYFEPPVNSSTIQDPDFPVLSRTLSFHFQDQTDFPALSRAWKIQGKKSRIFQDAWEPCQRPLL